MTSLPKNVADSTFNGLWRSAFWISFPFGVLSFLLPIYGREIGASALEIGGFFSAFSLVPTLIRPFLGRALDRWGRRPFFLVGLSGYGLSVLVFSWADTVLLLLTARFLQGIGAAFLWISAYTMLSDLSTRSGKGHDFGSLDEATYRGGLIGTTLGLTVFFTLQQGFGLDIRATWHWLFLFFLIPSVIGAAVGWKGTRETFSPALVQFVSDRPISPQLWILMGIVLVTGASQAMVWPLLMVYLQDHLGAGMDVLAFAYLPAALIGSFLPSRMGKVSDRLGRKLPMVGGLLVGAAASFLIPRLRSVIVLAILWSVETLGYSISVPAERAYVADIAGQDVRGTSYGLYTFAFFLGSTLGPLAGGWLYDKVGESAPFYLNTIVLLVGALLVLAALREGSPGLENPAI